LREGDASFVRW